MVINAKNRWGTIYPYLICSGRKRRTTTCKRQAMPMSLIDELIEDEYRTIALSPQLRDTIEGLDPRRLRRPSRQLTKPNDASSTAQRMDLTAQRQKLLEAHYAGAIPLDLLKNEQDRIGSQLGRIQEQLAMTDTNYEQARATLADTLDLTRDCHTAYLEADDNTRRLFNQAFFTKIYIDEDDETQSGPSGWTTTSPSTTSSTASCQQRSTTPCKPPIPTECKTPARRTWRATCELARRRSGAGLPSEHFGGAEGTRTPDPHTASVVRYQLRHSPEPR